MVIATGDDYADALVGAAFAVSRTYPVVLVSKDNVEEDILNYLKGFRH